MTFQEKIDMGSRIFRNSINGRPSHAAKGFKAGAILARSEIKKELNSNFLEIKKRLQWLMDANECEQQWQWLEEIQRFLPELENANNINAKPVEEK